MTYDDATAKPLLISEEEAFGLSRAAVMLDRRSAQPAENGTSRFGR